MLISCYYSNKILILGKFDINIILKYLTAYTNVN